MRFTVTNGRQYWRGEILQPSKPGGAENISRRRWACQQIQSVKIDETLRSDADRHDEGAASCVLQQNVFRYRVRNLDVRIAIREKNDYIWCVRTITGLLKNMHAEDLST